MKNKLIVSLIATSLLFASTSLIFASNDYDRDQNIAESQLSIAEMEENTKISEDYEIDSVRELKEKLNEAIEDGTITNAEQASILLETEPEVYKAFVAEKQSEMNAALNKIDIDAIMQEDANGDCSGKIIIDVGDGCQVIAEFEDCEETLLISKIEDLFIEPVFAATNGETVWKAYGNRYFTASKTMMLGPGASVIKMENHYKLSSSGITERYGYSSASAASLNGGVVAPQSPYITDETATTPGKSDVNMSCNYVWSEYAVPNVVTASGTWRMDTTIGYVDKNATDKKIKVKHSWSVH